MKTCAKCGEPKGKRNGRSVPQPILLKPSRKMCGWHNQDTPAQFWFATNVQD